MPVRRDQEGFTLIELLVVILIIAILAAVAIPAFLNQKEKGFEAQIQSGLKNASIAVESYSTSHGGNYSGLDTATNPDYLTKLAAEGFHLPPGFAYLHVVVTGNTFCIEAEHSRLTTSNDWRQAVFLQNQGGPETLPDTCP